MADLIDRDTLREAMRDCESVTHSIGYSDMIAILDDAPAVNRWIPCSERLPDALQNVIVCTDINTVTVAWINGEGWTFADTGGGHTETGRFGDVKYWMPLPEPPGGEDDG